MNRDIYLWVMNNKPPGVAPADWMEFAERFADYISAPAPVNFRSELRANRMDDLLGDAEYSAQESVKGE